MNEQSLPDAAHLRHVQKSLPWLLLLFVGSGCAALIYEIVWCQLLQLVIGSSAVSLGVLLGTFMGGMCLGSILLPRAVSPRHHPLRVYAFLELGLGIIGVALLFGMPHLDQLYSEAAGTGLPAILLRGILCAVCLLPPTFLMGATLPAIARWIQTSPQGVSWLGLFYGGNIAGAVFGCLLAGFYLLRVHDMAIATYVAATLNAVLAVFSFSLAALTPYSGAQNAERGAPGALRSTLGAATVSSDPPSASWSVYLAIALSGCCALAAEVIWTRLLSLMLGATVYTFSIILAVFLVGLGLGSSAGSLLARATLRPRIVLGGCQLLLTVAIAWTGVMLADSLPYWPIDPYLSKSPWLDFQLDLVRCFWAVLPPTCLWGASFPLALAARARPDQDPGRLVGGVYAANTVGAIAGAVGASLLLIRWLGTQGAQQVLIGLSALAGLIMLAPNMQPLRRVSLVAAAFVGPVLFLAWCVPEVPWELVAFGRSLPGHEAGWKILYLGEGMNSSVAVTELAGGVRNFHVSGKIEASTEKDDMRLQRLLGHIPALIHPKPRSVLVVGFGAGVTSGSFVVHPDIERIVICEIEPLVTKAVAPHFSKENYDVVHDPRVQIIYDDARHYILTTPYKFDIITSDPIHPWVKGSATLYTKEYFELCKRHLNPGGLITQWVPLYESSPDVVKSEIATFFEVFSNGTIWSNDKGGQGYDLVLLGQTEELKIDADELQVRLSRPDRAALAKSLEEIGFRTVVGLLATYGGQATDLRPWLENAAINRDRNLRLQYLAGMELNRDESRSIYDEMLGYRKFPENLLVGSGWRSRAVRVAIEHSISARRDSVQE